MEHIKLTKNMLWSNNSGAAICAAWTEGYTQKQIGKAFGYTSGNAVSAAIRGYLRGWLQANDSDIKRRDYKAAAAKVTKWNFPNGL